MDGISIVIPCYNDGEFLHRSVPSVANQLGPDDEIVIVDDGSSDATAEIAQTLAGQFPHRVTYVYQSNAGVSSARNHGIKISKQPFLLFLDADDELLPGALRSFRAEFEVGVDFYIGGHRWIRDGIVKERIPELGRDREKNFDNVLSKRIHIGNLSCMCFRRVCFADIQFDPSMRVTEDLVVILLVLATHTSKTNPNVITNVHRREGSLRDQAENNFDLESPMHVALFSHPSLPVAFQSYAEVARLRHYKSMLRVFWNSRDSEHFKKVFQALVAIEKTAWISKWGLRRLAVGFIKK